MKFWYRFNSDSYETSTPDPDDKWDRASTSRTWDPPARVYLRDPAFYESDEIDADLTPGQVIFLVWVQYSTGDSFGHDSGAGQEVIGWYLNHADAYRAKDAIDNGPKKYSFEEGGNTVMVPTFDGQGMRPQNCSSWVGYFESIDHVSIETVMVAA
jgi:hypothetical protein